MVFLAFQSRPILEEIWGRCACVARKDLILILRGAISVIVPILNLKIHARAIGRRRSCQETGIYRVNQAEAQGQWRRRNWDYLREYRRKNPAYTEKNRIRQRDRNRRWRSGSGIAKMDELIVEIGVVMEPWGGKEGVIGGTNSIIGSRPPT
jgi:hypothetical protein